LEKSYSAKVGKSILCAELFLLTHPSARQDRRAPGCEFHQPFANEDFEKKPSSDKVFE
jgi:hypothetical protein